MKTKQEIGSKYDKLQRSRNSKRKIQEDKKQVVKAIKRRKRSIFAALKPKTEECSKYSLTTLQKLFGLEVKEEE